ncbi:MAG: DNA primase, partial [Acetobacteraceae bacterium]|nr:DNA primase [Acetobacteraceae bacterium]
MPESISELARRLAENAEAVCRHYLSNGRRHGRYWIVGDMHNTKGRSLYVRLSGPSSGKGAAGKWTDAATGEHGDLLDLIAACRGFHQHDEVLAEARRFLGLVGPGSKPQCAASSGSPEAARRLFASSVPIGGTVAEAYLHRRGVTDAGDVPALRFHPRCFYRAEPGSTDTAQTAWPALV